MTTTTTTTRFYSALKLLRNRHGWDRWKQWVWQTFDVCLPVHRYGSVVYWDYAHRNSGSSSVSSLLATAGSNTNPAGEWAHVSHAALQSYSYHLLPVPPPPPQQGPPGSNEEAQPPTHSFLTTFDVDQLRTNSTKKQEDDPVATLHTTTLWETLGLSPPQDDYDNDKDYDSEDAELEEEEEKEEEEQDSVIKSDTRKREDRGSLGTPSATNSSTRSNNNNNNSKEPVLILGCGVSRLGWDMAHQPPQYYRGPIIQVDWSSPVMQVQSRLCRDQVEAGRMQLFVDNATELSSQTTNGIPNLRPNSIQAVVDKGLLDPLSCTYLHHDRRQVQVHSMMQAVHRVLKPLGYYCIWSLSQPEYFWPVLFPNSNGTATTTHHKQEQEQQRLWQNVEIRYDVSNQLLLYRLQKAPDPTRLMAAASKKKKKKNKKKQTPKKKR